MSIADQENIRQLLKRVAALEEKVAAMEASNDLVISKIPETRTLLERIKKAAQRMEI